jgi:modulator of FtsH protease HflC
MRGATILVIALIGLVVSNSAFYTLPEGLQALITQFGQIQGEPITKAGLHFKVPLIQEVRYFDKRILTWDGDEEQITTKDKKFIIVDSTARWRITNVRKFAESLRSEDSARGRLDAVLDSATRQVVSKFKLVEVVRNSNSILQRLAVRQEEESGRAAAAAASGIEDIEEEITGEIEPIENGREKLSLLIAQNATKDLSQFGIELIDVQFRRISYERSVEDKVYDRMIAERNRIAEKIRSTGKGEEAKINGTLNLDLKRIESEAYRKSQEIKGNAEAKAIDIYAKSMKQDPKYYKFIRTMEAYKKTLSEKGHVILSTDSDFMRYLEVGAM